VHTRKSEVLFSADSVITLVGLAKCHTGSDKSGALKRTEDGKIEIERQQPEGLYKSFTFI
jgi:hypothetical protein